MVMLIFKMNTIIYILLLIYGIVLADEIDEKLHNETIFDDNLKSRSSETTTELTNIVNNANKSDERLEKSPIYKEDDADSTPTTIKTEEIDNTESLSDFDDLEYGRNENNAEDDFVDEDRVATELNKEKNVRKVDARGSEDGVPSVPVPVIDAAVRDGKVKKNETDDHSRSASNENSEVSSESKPSRRMFHPVLINHEDRVAPDYTQLGSVPNPLHIFGHNFGRLPSPPYSSTPYPQGTNGFYAPFNRYPIAQNTNPYTYMNKSPKSYEYPNSYENSNNYPYIAHRNKDPMPLMAHNMYGAPGQEYYRRIVPGIINNYSSPYPYSPGNTNNYGTQPFGHGRFV